RNLILRLKTEQNKTILLSSHQLSEIELIANRMVIINKGKTLVEGDVSELLNQQEVLILLEVDNVEKAMNLIYSKFPLSSPELNASGQIELTLQKNQTALLNKELIQAEILVSALEPKRKLEDFFIKIIGA
ncbi:MAG: ABC transporter ATP-binding protein, partial [Crocinitomicaceae bacterium]